ncbi:hypothetical protein OWR29_39740 [Actinoplanes sp. Pm04-4]|uniref:Hemerythrin n=1 Tax=Paractinoplanes pyxinae TaxID=2997416 RepID=A0ABT4BF08_9ACTN|nr:hypothetical protein [Actinoplanes pyxinae]MCY1144163.1 hypothetical protein [Actinoplanes pyxinae]
MPLSYPTQPGDIDHLIADDHAIVERQFQHLEAGRGDRRTLVDQIGFELALHAFAEELCCIRHGSNWAWKKRTRTPAGNISE